jgi:hypothetical protein
LEVVDLIASDPDIIVQNSWSDLDLKTLDQFNDFQTGLSGNTILYLDVHLRYAQRGGCDFLEIQTLGVSFEPKALTSKYLYNRLNLASAPRAVIFKILIKSSVDFLPASGELF